MLRTEDVVLVACGSFNPPTVMHIKMFDLAASALRKVMYMPAVPPERDSHSMTPTV